MNASTVIIVLILLAIGVFAIREYRRRVTRGCCGGGDTPPKAIRVADKDPNHYPYILHLKVEGMTCPNCAIKVENALNSLAGVWAKVDLAKATATVRMKKEISPEELTAAIAQAGYAGYIK